MAGEPREILTEHLRLRPPTLQDVDAIFAYGCDPEVTRLVGWATYRTREAAEVYVGSALTDWDRLHGPRPYLATLRSDGTVIGSTGTVPDHGVQIGYIVARSHWGRGYATEMARAMVQLAFASPHVFRVWALCDTTNLASARVLEKCGMTCEGILRKFAIHPNVGPMPRDCFCYAAVR